MGDLEQIESSQRQHYETMRHNTMMEGICTANDMALFVSLKPRLFIDGNQWCVLYGDNIHDGICGFGSSPIRAILCWNAEWHRSLPPNLSDNRAGEATQSKQEK